MVNHIVFFDESFATSFDEETTGMAFEASSTGVQCFPAQGSWDSASAGWRLIPMHWTTSNFLSDSRGRHRASFPLASVGISIHLKTSWFIQTVKLVLSRYRRSNNTAHMTVRHSRRVLKYQHLSSVPEHEQCPIGLSCLYAGFNTSVYIDPVCALCWRDGKYSVEISLIFNVFNP